MVPARSMPLRVEPTTRMAYTSSSDNSEDETRDFAAPRQRRRRASRTPAKDASDW